jgi:NAD(P)-dependent dehydrogenase (short-subunit alcohol dehydrogenase family)
MNTNLFDLKGRVVVMTGATGVLGKSISTYFALQGAKLAILVRVHFMLILAAI